MEQKKRSYKTWARDEIKTHLSVFAEDELYSAAPKTTELMAERLTSWQSQNEIQFNFQNFDLQWKCKSLVLKVGG